MKNWKIKNQPVHWFRLTELNKTIVITCGRNSSKTKITDEILQLSFNTQNLIFIRVYGVSFWPSIAFICVLYYICRSFVKA